MHRLGGSFSELRRASRLRLQPVFQLHLADEIELDTFGEADLRVVRFAVFWEITFVVLAGLIGNGHHYFWIGMPAYWQFWGSLFSALEPLPMLLAMWSLYMDARRGQRAIANRPALYFIFGSVLLELVGAGILGFTQTFALTNLWEHGTWVTASHAHVALFGTFGFLVLGGAYAALPPIKGIRQPDHRTATLALSLLFAGLLGMTMSFALGGTAEIYVYRILGLDWFAAEVRPAIALWRALLGVSSLVFVAGAGLVVYDLFNLKERGPSLRACRQTLLSAGSGDP